MKHTDVATIRSRLRRAWSPFFTRFGKLTAVQIEAIPKVLDGLDVVIASPTASGKTEAVVAPVAERFCREQRDSLAILYVVPTRALANDALARIEGPLGDMGIKTALKHGDKPYLNARRLPNCLITTPESLDSLICRRSEVFARLRAVILDEIHLLDNTYRGDQLRILLSRLHALVQEGQYSTYLLSATLAAPEDITRRYASSSELIVVPGQREINYHILDGHQGVYTIARERGWKKLLYFCNMRESVEAAAAQLTRIWDPYPVVAHHGSLSRSIREEAETVMRETDVGVCVATSTLEVGIDIGDIDLVVLAEVPWSISSLLQRIGRGNRRDDAINAAVITTSEAGKEVMQAMFRTAASGSLPTEEYSPDLSVAVQQIFSCLFQHPEGVSETDIVQLVCPLCSAENARLMLGHLHRRGWTEQGAKRWFASTKLMDLGEKGRIHSNIPDSQSYRVVDADSGREIGKIAGVFDRVFVLGRSAWKVISVSGDVIRARRFKGKAEAPLFQRCGNVGAFHNLLPPELKAANHPQ